MDFFIESDIGEIAEGMGETRKAFEGKSVLITGGRGFLGRYFIEVLARLNESYLEKPCRLVVLDNLISSGAAGTLENDKRKYTFVKHNIIEPIAFGEPVDYIIQAAGIASPFYYRKYPLETLEVATIGTKNMLNIARDHGASLLYFSSSEIYGDPDPRYVPTPESYRGNVSSLGPRACYDESKRLGETICRIYHEQFGVRTRIVRPFNVYGPGMQETDYRVLPNFAAHIKANRSMRVYGTGNQTRTYCYVTDAIVGFFKTLVGGTPGESYNIGNPKPEISVLDLVGRIEGVLGRKLDVDRVAHPDSYPADEPNRRCPDITKARLQLDYHPKVGLDEGLGRFLRWAMEVYAGDV